MGGCLSSNSSPLSSKERFDRQPTDTAQLDPQAYPPLAFKALLTKLKLKWCSFYKHVSIRINFGPHQQFQLKSKFIAGELAKWDVYHDFDFVASQLDLRKQFMTLNFFDQHSRSIGNLRINLFLLATGPYHQDFAVPLAKAESARISFNLKIAQEVGIRLKVKEVQLHLKDRQFPGDIFAFNLNSIMGDRLDESELSYKYLVDFKESEVGQLSKGSLSKTDQKSILTERSTQNSTSMKKSPSREWEGDLKSNIHRSPTSKSIQSISWIQNQQRNLPSLQLTVPLFDLHGASFNVIFYSFRSNKREFLSECFFSYNKMASYESASRVDPASKKTFEERTITMEAKTWDHGKHTGKAIFSFSFTLEKHLKQMQLCVRTERGILESSPVFGDKGRSKLPEELVELQKLAKQIQSQFIQASQQANKSQKWVLQVNKKLLHMRNLLQSSSKESKLMFIYQDEKALLRGQKGFIQICKRIRSLLDQDQEEIAANCWDLLIVIAKRGEFSLAHMGFTQEQAQICISRKANDFLSAKKEVSLSYHILLVDLLQLTLKSLENYNYESQREFAELFCALAYFRLPKFRNQVLSIITRNDDPEVEEWRGTEYTLTQTEIESPDRKTAFRLMFDWENSFYKVLAAEEDYSKTEAKLTELMRTNEWEERMEKRGGAFFAFVRYWVSFIESIAVNSKHISWRYFPGYQKILLSFFAEMKLRPLSRYSEAMKRAAASLLSNQKLLNPLVLIVFKKTNLNNQLNVVKALDLVGIFLSSISRRRRAIPGTFDFKLLFKAIRDILEGEASFAIGKTLIVLYDHFGTFPIEFRIEVSNYLLTRVFFKLFLHWSLNVRTIFYHLLFIRIFHEASKPLEHLDAKEQEVYRFSQHYRTNIEFRYKKLMLILENAQQFQHKIQGRKVQGFEMDSFRKMRKKIQEKFRGQASPSLPKRALFQDQEQYQKQLMLELAEPKLQRYNSEVLSRTLKVVVEKKREVQSREEVIVRNSLLLRHSEDNPRRRKIKVADINFETQLVPIRQEEVVYIGSALEQFNKISEGFIKTLEKSQKEVPVVRLQLSLDEKELRPEGLSDYEEW